MIEAYIDESGVHDDSPVLTVAAYLGTPGRWANFTDKWSATLDSRGVKIFHATDCSALQGEFSGWTVDDKNKFVAGLLPIIPEFIGVGFAAGIVMRDFDEALKERDELRSIFGTPYTMCFQWVLHEIVAYLNNNLSSARVAIFHEKNDYYVEASDRFRWVKEHHDDGNNLLSITFGTKEDYVPLQAADVLAYESNRRLRNIDGPERQAFKALDPAGYLMKVIYYNRDNMPAIVEILEEFQRGANRI